MSSIFEAQHLLFCKIEESSKKSIKGQLWIENPVAERWVQGLMQKFSLSSLASYILACRTQTFEEAESFLNPSLKNHLPDPRCLPDIHQAISLLSEALSQKKSIALWGDYDVDGATSSALWINFFKALSCDAKLYIPDRFREGYGPNSEGLKKLAQEGVQVVVMVDCGTTAFTPLQVAQDCGLEVVVIDHHMPESHLPPCKALVNPKRLDAVSENIAFESLAAVGLSFLVIIALNRHLRENNFYTAEHPEPSLIAFLDLVALGTVCDVMPLLGVNRLFVQKGLEVMAQRFNLGLKTLMDVSNLREKPSAYHLGFVLGPRINAGGRIGASSLGTQLLTTADPEEAFRLAIQLDELNKERQEIEKTLENDAMEQAGAQEDQSVLIVSEKGWHQGVIGIIASRLKERFYKPSFIISWEGDGPESIGKGSARSIPGIDIGSLIHEAHLKGILMHGGGHKMAGGFSLQYQHFDAFKVFLIQRVQELCPQLPKPYLRVTPPLTFNALGDNLLNQILSLAPFGQGNPQPVAVFHEVRLKALYPVGAQHLRAELIQLDGSTASAMAFRARGTALGEFLLSGPDDFFSIAATLQRSHYTGKIQLILEDITFPR
jgi:single-stranded-DNA-specific exonuclease